MFFKVKDGSEREFVKDKFKKFFISEDDHARLSNIVINKVLNFSQNFGKAQNLFYQIYLAFAWLLRYFQERFPNKQVHDNSKYGIEGIRLAFFIFWDIERFIVFDSIDFDKIASLWVTSLLTTLLSELSSYQMETEKTFDINDAISNEKWILYGKYLTLKNDDPFEPVSFLPWYCIKFLKL